jgi:hypothetical protein
MTREEAESSIVKYAKELLQWHLDDVGHGTVDTVDIAELGWGETCIPVLLLKAYRILNKKEVE